MPLLRRSTAALPELEMVPLAERLRAMAVFRLILAGLLVLASASLPGLLHDRMSTVIAVTVGYLMTSIAGYLLWRIWPGRGLVLFSGLLLLDGLFLVWATYLAGGVGSPVSYLVIAYVVAVTLLASYRAGLKLVLWQSVLLMVGYELQGTAVLPALGIHAAPARSDYRGVMVFVVGMWLVGIVTATHSALNERELRRRRYDLTALTNMASELERDMRPAAIAAVFLHSTVETFDFVRGVVLSRSEDGRLSTLASHRASPTTGAFPATPKLERTWTAREPMLAKALSETEDGGLTKLLPDARNVVVVPLIAEGSPIGALVAEHSKARIEQRALTILAQFASHASLALRNAWLLEEMRTMADRDGLTGVANRRSFDARLELEIKRALRTAEPMSLLLLDLDHFKAVNDVLGHQAGDDVLRALATMLSAHAREIDMPARYGGEEFALILPGCGPEDALLVAERLRSTVPTLGQAPAGLTTSVGVATCPRNAVHPSALVSAAAEALYEAKRGGRNRVVLSGTTVAQPQQ